MEAIIDTVLILVALLLVAVVVFAATRPNKFRLQRSVVIAAPAETIYPLIADFRKWALWSPWDNLDPEMKRTYEGAPIGLGAIYTYEGNKTVGAGRMEIVEAQLNRKVVAKLHFIKPFEAHNTAEFILVQQADGTEVTWAMYGPQTFMGRLMGIVLSMERLVGGQFEQGLASLKAVAEGREGNA